MKKLLFVTKNFPPQIGGGIRRIEAIYRILKKREDLKIDVVTAIKNEEYNPFYIPQRFVKDSDEKNKIRFMSRFSKIKLIDKAFIGWFPFVLFFILRKKYDYVLVTCPVFTNVIIGFFYKLCRFGKPKLIVEYRDLFAFNPSYKNGFKKSLFKIFETIIIWYSDYIIVTTHAMQKLLSKIVNEKKIFVVRNYISSDDVVIAKNLDKIQLNTDFYNIAHIGKLNTGRNPVRALDLLKYKIDNKYISLYFIGVNEMEKEWIIEKARDFNYDTNRLFFLPEVDRITSLKYMKSFDALFLLINNESKIEEGYGIPGKLYDYVAINNNIFSDIDSFNNLKSEFSLKVKQQLNGYINYEVLENRVLDDILNNVFDKILK